MLLTLLVYAYATGQRSSRKIEQLCGTDVAFRVVCAQDVPDHCTIARFRKDHDEAVEGLFTQVLVLAGRAGLARLGKVAIDGTKIAANASDDALRSEKWLREKVAEMLAEAERADAAEDDLLGDRRGDELPQDLADPVTREQRIKKVLADLETEQTARAQARADAQAQAVEYLKKLDSTATVAGRTHPGPPPRGTDKVTLAQLRLDRTIAKAQTAWEKWLDRQARAAAEGRPVRGREGVPVEDTARVKQARLALERAKEQAGQEPRGKVEPPSRPTLRNVTDPDSRPMPTRKGWIGGYNAQLAVSEDQIIIAAELVQTSADVNCFIPMLRAAEEAAQKLSSAGSGHATIGTVLADAGYRSMGNITAPGPDRLIATGKGRDDERRAQEHPVNGPPPEAASALEAMDHRLRTAEGRALYRNRSPQVEGVNGQLKDVLGLRRFSRRGLRATSAELSFAATVHNLLKIYRAQAATA